MSILQTSGGNLQLCDDEIPSGSNNRGAVAVDNGPDSPDEYDARPDDTFRGYSRGRVVRGLDRLAAEMAALPDDQSYVESPSEAMQLDKAIRAAVCSALVQLPEGSDLVIRREQRWASHQALKRTDAWSATVIPGRPTWPPTSVAFGVRVRELDRLSKAIVAKWRRRELSRQRQGAEMDSMCETDSGPRRPAA